MKNNERRETIRVKSQSVLRQREKIIKKELTILQEEVKEEDMSDISLLNNSGDLSLRGSSKNSHQNISGESSQQN